MRKLLLAVAVVYSLIGLVYVLDDGTVTSNASVRAGTKTWAGQCPPVELAPTCGRADLYPTEAP